MNRRRRYRGARTSCAAATLALVMTIGTGISRGQEGRRPACREGRHVRLGRHAARPDGEVRQGRRHAHLQGIDEEGCDRRERHDPGLPAEHRRRLVHDGDRRVPGRPRLDEQHVLPARRRVLEPDVVLGPRRDQRQPDRPAGGHDRQRRRAGRQEGRSDRLGGGHPGQDRRPDGRLRVLLQQPRGARRRGGSRRAGRRGSSSARSTTSARPQPRPAGRTFRSATRRRRRRRRPGRSRARSPRRTRTAPTTSTSTTARSTAPSPTTTRSSARSARQARARRST